MGIGWLSDGELAVGSDVALTAGHIHALADYWLMTNDSSSNTYCVENLEGTGEYVKVQAGRCGVPIPFELSRILLTVANRQDNLVVFAPERAEVGQVHNVGGERLPLLDETSRYYMVLVCLCESRLRNCGVETVPTPTQICRRLASFGDDQALSRSAVNYHIDYLAEKLDVLAPIEGKRIGKREVIAGLALKFDLVRPEHLALLPRQAKGGRAEREPASRAGSARRARR